MKDRQLKELKKYATIASEQISRVKQCIQQNRYMEVAAMRSALESALKVYWIYRWDCYDPTESLHNKIICLAENEEFNIVIINNMKIIQKSGNQELHDGKIFDMETVNELFDIFKKCICAISDKVGINLINNDTAIIKQHTNTTFEDKYTNYKGVNIMRNKIDLGVFWRTFEQILMENGEPFKIIYTKEDGTLTHYADVNRVKLNLSICMDISLVRRENFLRVGLYINNIHSQIGRIILANKERINDELSFAPLWEQGARNANALRVIVKFPINDNSCRDLIENALPYIIEFIAVADKYGKNYFFDF